MSDVTLPQRSETPAAYQWNAESVFANVQAWETEFRGVEAALPRLEAAKSLIRLSAKDLLGVIKMVEDIIARESKLAVYANMAHSVDMEDQNAAALFDRVQNLQGKVAGATAFLSPGLLAIGREKIDQWLEQEPRLRIYQHFFDDLFRKSEHVRSAEVEELMGMLASPLSGPSMIYGSLTDADFKFKPAVVSDGHRVPVSQGTIDSILLDPDREIRRTAWENYRDVFVEHKNALTNILVTSVKADVFDMQARKHKNTLEASLYENKIPVEVFHNLIKVFKKNLPTWRRYWKLRRQALKVDTLHPYDIWAPLTSAKPQFDFNQVVDYIAGGVAPLGKDYVKSLTRGVLTDRWVDVYPNRGKTAGAFSSGSYGTHPFVLMSFTSDIESLSTLAHELGHSMHSYLTWKTQPFIYSNYSLFIAEVASNFHQAMVRAHLLNTMKDPGVQVAILEEAMSNFHRYFFIMPTLAQFELEVHRRVERGEGLTADAMIDLMTGLFQEGYGGEMHIDKERVGMTWATFGHLYYDYYVFQYATGISAAHALSKRILDGVPGAAEDYIRFLSAGSSVYPLDALKMAGVDLTTPQPVEDTFAVLAGYVEKLENLLLK
jgi:oligoendopeptidase F